MFVKRGGRGFTLIEMVAVMTVIALMLFFLKNFQWGRGSSRQLQIAAQMVTTFLRQTRQKAMTQRRDVFIAIDFSTQNRLLQLIWEEEQYRVTRELQLPEHCFITNAEDDVDKSIITVNAQSLTVCLMHFASDGSYEASNACLSIGCGRRSLKEGVILEDDAVTPKKIIVNRLGRAFILNE